MEIQPIPCLSDNYAYLLMTDTTTVVVDPSEPGPVLAALTERGRSLDAIFCTHHHHDHVGGNRLLTSEFVDVEVFGHVSDKGRIPEQTRLVEQGDEITCGDIRARIIHNPGHTSGAISYYVGESQLFTGDTLFLGGCGRLFEGTAADMVASFDMLAALPGATLVYCGHEYTESNLRFAREVEPANDDIAKRIEEVAQKRAGGFPSVPASLALEKRTNPFMRVRESSVIAAAQRREPSAATDPASVFAAIRTWKDGF